MTTKAKTLIYVISERWNIVQRVDGSASAVIRRWGTTKGLGQLAMHGPQKDTILDSCGVLHIAPDKVLFTIECDDSVWDKVKF